jgi:hypothetical protein
VSSCVRRPAPTPPSPCTAARLGFQPSSADEGDFGRTMLHRQCRRVRVELHSAFSTARPLPRRLKAGCSEEQHLLLRYSTYDTSVLHRKHGRGQDHRQGELVQRRQGLRCVPVPCRAASPPTAQRRSRLGLSVAGAGRCRRAEQCETPPRDVPGVQRARRGCQGYARRESMAVLGPRRRGHASYIRPWLHPTRRGLLIRVDCVSVRVRLG